MMISKPRVAIIFDNQARPETTGFYCRRALAQLADVEHFLPEEMAQISAGEFDLFLRIDDGLQIPWRTDLQPAAWWMIDTHLEQNWYTKQAQHFDWLFTAQRDGAEFLRSRGLPASWLPLACDPEIHSPQPTDKRFDVAFVGHLFSGPRTDLLQQIQRRYPQSFIGQCYFEEMARTYSAARIVFNRSLRNDINMRVFEALASGSLLLTNDLTDNGQAELFEPGCHLLTYRDEAEVWDRIEWALQNPGEREAIAAAGQSEVLARHTYQHRMEHILRVTSGPPAIIRPEMSSNAGSLQNPLPPPKVTRDNRDNIDGVSSNLNGTRTIPVKDHSYFEFPRPDVEALVPLESRQILDLGCGSGRLGASLKSRPGVTVIGVELVPEIAKQAALRLDEVVTGDLESSAIDFAEQSFDCVIAADVLEHLRSPNTTLASIRRWLRPDGSLILSLPNVRHHSVITGLLAGNWTYESAGLLDEDHVRFFTRREIEKLLFRAGFKVEQWRIVPGPGYREWVEQGQPGEVRLGGLQITGLSPQEAEEFFAYQYLIRAVPLPKSDEEPTSIIILTHNELAYTRECLSSIRLRTDEPYELIVVDNGSTDGTVEYLQTQPDVRLICNLENRGFPAGVNQGLEIASGSNIVLLNNDCVVTTGWLRRLLDALRIDSRIGLVGPYSNRASGYQQVSTNYDDLSALDGFAWGWGKRHAGRVRDVERLIGFCLLLRREVVERIGLLDERFGIGCYEDDDYCRRARDAGYRLVIAEAAFIHHYGSRTFQGSGANLAAILQENEQRYREKWNAATVTDRSIHEQCSAEVSQATMSDASSTSPESPMITGTQKRRSFQDWDVELMSEGGLRVTPASIRLSACLIVRDNESTIRPCLESLRPYVDEIIVVDTGSQDRTPQICQELGARVEHFPWCDDFAAARNESLKYATGQWIFWMDSDDTFPAACGQKLRELVFGPHPDDRFGYVLQVHCPGDEPHDVTVVDHVKLFRNRPDLRFEFRIHEQILPAIRRAGGEVAFTDIYVVHSGSDRTLDGKQRKLERDLRILYRELDDHPEHPFVLFNLGMTYADAGKSQQAVQFLEDCLRVSQSGESHVRKAYALLVSALRQSHEPETAQKRCQDALTRFPQDLELNFLHALLLQETGELRQAAAVYDMLLKPQSSRHFSSLDAGLSSYKARQNLAVIWEELEEWDRALEQWEVIVRKWPLYRGGWRGLGEFLLRRGRLLELNSLLEVFPAENTALQVERQLLIAQQLILAGDVDEALSACDAAQKLEPDRLEALQRKCRILFEYGSPDAACAALQELTRRCPADPAAWHNLGALWLSQGAYQTAWDCLEVSHKLRPGYGPTDELRATLRQRLQMEHELIPTTAT